MYIHACNSFRLFSEKQGPEDEGVYRNWLKWEGTDHNTPLDQSPCSQWNGVWGGDVSSPLYRFIVVLHSCMYLFSTISGISVLKANDCNRWYIHVQLLINMPLHPLPCRRGVCLLRSMMATPRTMFTSEVGTWIMSQVEKESLCVLFLIGFETRSMQALISPCFSY